MSQEGQDSPCVYLHRIGHVPRLSNQVGTMAFLRVASGADYRLQEDLRASAERQWAWGEIQPLSAVPLSLLFIALPIQTELQEGRHHFYIVFQNNPIRSKPIRRTPTVLTMHVLRAGDV